MEQLTSDPATRAERFASWKRCADGSVYDIAGFWPNHVLDDPRFTWWTWFDAGLSAEQAAEELMHVLTDDAVAAYIHALR